MKGSHTPVNKPVSNDRDPQVLINILSKQRRQAEDRAFTHILKLGPNQCHQVEVDPLPELPLDSVMWGTPVYCKITPKTSYQVQF